MNLVVITCKAYSDVWPAFFGLLEKFWPAHPPVTLLTDEAGPEVPEYVTVFEAGAGAQWCDVLARYVETATEPFLLMQEDLLLSAPVRPELIREARNQMCRNTGGVRLYPCPGATWAIPPSGRLGVIDRNEPYWISCMATIWAPAFLRWLLSQIQCRDAASFEIEGTRLADRSDSMNYMMLGWMRGALPWPLEYICSAVSRTRWNPDAKVLCDAQGVSVDWSQREMHAR